MARETREWTEVQEMLRLWCKVQSDKETVLRGEQGKDQKQPDGSCLRKLKRKVKTTMIRRCLHQI